MKFGDFNAGYNFTDLYYIEFKIDNSYDALLRLNKSQEISLEESKKHFEEIVEEVERENKQLDPQDLNCYVQQHFYGEEMVIHELRRLQRFGLIISIFSFYEAQLKELCELVELKFHLNKKLDDFKGVKGDLNKYWTYLIKVYRMTPTATIEELFKVLNSQKRIRNSITHSDGVVNEKDAKNLVISKGINLRELDKKFLIEIEKDIYIEFLLNSIRTFFKELLQIIDSRYNELINS